MTIADPRALLNDFHDSRNRFNIFTHERLLDYRKIAQLLEKQGSQPLPVELIELSDTADTIDTIAPFEAEFPAPDHAKHYTFKRRMVRTRPLALYRLRDVTLRIARNAQRRWRIEFYLFDKQKRLINGLFFGARPQWVEPTVSLPGTTAFIDDFFAGTNISHLLFDKYPRAYWAGEKTSPDRYALFKSHSYAEALYARCGDTLIGLLPLVSDGGIHFEELILCQNSFGGLIHPGHAGSAIHRAAWHSLRAALGIGQSQRQPEKRIFIDRQSAKGRRVKNWNTIAQRMENAGILLTDPGQHDFEAQVDIFKNCRVIAGVHGAGLTNMIFMPPGGTVIEILPACYGTQTYWWMAHLLGHDYRAIVVDDDANTQVDPDRWTHDNLFGRHDVIMHSAQADRLMRLVDRKPL